MIVQRSATRSHQPASSSTTLAITLRAINLNNSKTSSPTFPLTVSLHDSDTVLTDQDKITTIVVGLFDHTYLYCHPLAFCMAETRRKAKTAEEIAALTGGDIEPIEETFASVRIIHDEE